MAQVIDRQPPFNLEAERAVLGACLLDKDALALAVEKLHTEDFYDPRHAQAFELLLSLFEKGTAVDAVTFLNEIQSRGVEQNVGGQPFIAAIMDSVSTSANTEYYADIVLEKAVLRGLITVGTDITKLGYTENIASDEALEKAEQSIYELARTGRTTTIREAKDVVTDAFRDIESRLANGTSFTGISTGFRDFDKISGGLQPGSLYILAARPSMGKTALALNIGAYVALEENTPVLIFSLEMSAEQVANRMIAAESRVNLRQLLDVNSAKGNVSMNSAEWKQLADAAGRLEKCPLYIDETAALSTIELRAKCRRFFAKQKTDKGLIVLDYLQLMDASRRTDNRQQDVSEISRALKAIAREFKVPVLALSQLSRAVESRQDKRPMLSDLRESGAIEQDADMVMFIYREAYYKQEAADQNAELIVAKNRNGATGKVDFVFFNEYTRFEPMIKSY